MADYTLEKIQKLPPDVLAVITDDDTNRRYAEEVASYLTEDENLRLSQLVLDVYFRVVTPTAFLSLCREIVADEQTYKDVMPLILGLLFLPVADYLQADVRKMILDNGGDPNVYAKKIPARDAVAYVRRRAATPIADEVISRRLDKIIASKITNVRNDAQVKSLLMGPPKTSGIGLEEEQAEALLMAAQDEVAALLQRGIEVVPDDIYDAEQAAAESDVVAGLAPLEPAVAESPAAGVSSPIARPAPDGAGTATTQNLVPDNFVTVTMADEREIEAIRRQTKETVASAPASFEEYVAKALGEAGLPATDEEIRRRGQTIVELYFRDLRDTMETKAKLTMPILSGGLGLADGPAETSMSKLAARRREYEDALSQGRVQEKEKFVADQARRQILESERQSFQERADLDARFRNLVKRSDAKPSSASMALPVAPPPAPMKIIPVTSVPKAVSAAAVPAPTSVAPTTAPLTPPPALLTEKPQPTPAPAAVAPSLPLAGSRLPQLTPAVANSATADASSSRARPAPDGAGAATTASDDGGFTKTVPPPPNLPGATSLPLAPQAKAATTPGDILPVRPAAPTAVAASPLTPPKPPPLPMVPSAQPVPTPAPTLIASAPKDVVTDIRAAQRLTGPVEELRSLTLVDFIRYSKDAKEAILKIKDKIDLLEDQSFEVKTQGIKAWQESPANRMYLDILRQSLEGKPVIEVITAMEQKGEKTLNKAQFDAILQLNRMLRFG